MRLQTLNNQFKGACSRTGRLTIQMTLLKLSASGSSRTGIPVLYKHETLRHGHDINYLVSCVSMVYLNRCSCPVTSFYERKEKRHNSKPVKSQLSSRLYQR